MTRKTLRLAAQIAATYREGEAVVVPSAQLLDLARAVLLLSAQPNCLPGAAIEEAQALRDDLRARKLIR